MTRVSVLQMTSSHSVLSNLKTAATLIEQAVDKGAKLVVLPENFAVWGETQDKLLHAEEEGRGLVQDFLSSESGKHGIWLVGGTLPLKSDKNEKKVYSATLVYDNRGALVARYNKIHLFDVSLPGSQEIYSESNIILPGDTWVVIPTPIGRLGLAICYDLRFGELFRHLQNAGAEMIAVPAAFTQPTGRAHWEVLLRSRAIENQAYVLASGQTGMHDNGRKTYGYSMIVDPWGEIKASLREEVGIAVGEVNLETLHRLRVEFPVLSHKKL